jgi:hypothetical protein
VADRLTTDELLTAASDAFRGDRASARSILDGVRARAGERAREAFDQRLGGASGGSRAAPSRPLPALRTSPPPRPAGPMTIRVNGRRSIASATTPAARRDDVELLRRTTAANERALLDEIGHQRKVTARLERATAELSTKVEAIEKRTDQAVMGVVEGLGKFKKQIGPVGGASQVAALAQAAQIQQVSNVVASVQSAAYGERGSVLSSNNLLLAGNQLAWMFAGPALQRLGIMSGATAQLITSLAPLGTLITGGLTLGRSQHVRFVSGVAKFEGTQQTYIESLRPRIADADWEEFSRRVDIPVSVTTFTGVPFTGTAIVRDGVLVISLPGGGGGGFLLLEGPSSGSLAWMVDTGADGG